MKTGTGAAVFWLASFFLVSGTAFSLDISNVLQGSEGEKLEDPPQGNVPLPVPAAPRQQAPAYSIPALPPSLTCKAEDVWGVWELQHVYEAPPGNETAAYNLNPVQYIAFQKDSRFFRYNAGRTRMPGDVVLKNLQLHSGALTQYVLQDAGMLYLYQDGVATETMVCFIISDTRPPFPAGDLLLIPPKGQITGRLVKEYKKVWPPKPPPPPNPNPMLRR